MKLTIDRGALVVALASLTALPLAAEPLSIAVTAQTETAGSDGDVDDPAIWVNPLDPAQSLILGADKQAGLFVYGLDGVERAFFPDGKLNNVDLRPFVLDGQQVSLAGATRRDDDTLVFYVIEDGAVRKASPWQHPAIPEGVTADDIYGFAMGQDAGGTYAIANFKSGHVIQWRITAAGGEIALTLARVWQVETQPEGMVADDRDGFLYVGEEDAGIWRVPLSPEAEAVPVVIDAIPSACLPVDDVEGLAIFDGTGSGGGRYLVASAQGIHRAAIYALDGAEVPVCQALVEIAPGVMDGVTETDGLEVTSTPLGPDFPAGMLVMMDDQNAGFTINFKLIDWQDIAAQLPAE